MKVRHAMLPLTALALTFGAPGSPIDEPLRAAGVRRLVSSPATLPLLFERLDAGEYGARSRGYTVAITAAAVSLSLPAGEAMPPARVRLSFGGARATGIAAEQPLATTVNYFKGRQGDWRTGVKTFGRVRMSEVYPGIDVLFYGNDRRLEYDFLVAAGADPQQIVMRFEGADHVTRNAAGDLVVTAGGRELVQHEPIAYQEVEGSRVPVRAEYVVHDNTARLALGSYDRTRTLVIDPVLSYSTYFGATEGDAVTAAATDAAGNLYIGGWSQGGDLPAPGLRPHDGTRTEFNIWSDGYVAKLRPDGSVDWLTFLGGNDTDQVRDLAIGPGGDVFVTGFTASTNFPTTAGAYDPVGHNDRSAGGEPGDAFVMRLSGDARTIHYSTYFGGGEFWGGDIAYAIAVDAQGRAHVVGEAASMDFPVTIESSRGAERPDYYNREAFVAKFSADGARVEWSRLLSGVDFETAADAMLDQNGGIYVVGTTTSTDFPVHNAVQPTKFGPDGQEGEYGRDGYLTHLWTDGSIVYSTFLGGPGEDIAAGIARGQFDRIYVVGTTTSETMAGAQWPRRGGADDQDGFIMQIVPNATSIVSTRFVGGAGPDALHTVAVDHAESVWIAGRTESTNLATTNNAPQQTYGGAGDAFIEQWQADLWGVGISSYLGGAADDGASALAVDPSGNVYVVGGTASANFPTTASALQPSIKPASQPYYVRDGFVAKFACVITVFGASQSVGAGAGAGSISIHRERGCTPIVSSNVAWLGITNVDADSVDFAYEQNTTTSPRTATIDISGQQFTVTQAGAASTTPPASDPLEHVLSPAFASVITGTWQRPADAGGGSTDDLVQPNAGAAKISTALASPANYFELTFDAEAGRPYRLWMRGRAQDDYWGNDSVHVQFSGSVDAAGTPIYRIGTTSAAAVNLEECSGCGLSGWGWQDNGWGSRGLLGPEIRFAASGPQTIRVQQREDGFRINQIVLSAERYLHTSPGVAKNDTTQLPVTNAPGSEPEPEANENPKEIVLYASDASRLAGAWAFAADETAAGGARARVPNAGAPKVTEPLASPADFVEFTFNAEAAIPYRVWLRMKADADYWGNDSVWVQFSGSVDFYGAAVNRIGTTSGSAINLEECSGCGLDGWGWQDEGWGAPGKLGPTVYFATTGPQVLRIQTREDGVSFDQVVISADRFVGAAPGPAKRDGTIVPK